MPSGPASLEKDDIVFGPAATAAMLSFMNWIGFSGGMARRGYSCLREDQVGTRVLSDKITIVDDPTRRESFPTGETSPASPASPTPSSIGASSPVSSGHRMMRMSWGPAHGTHGGSQEPCASGVRAR